MPKISIITPCYNSAAFLKETFKAVQAQTFSDWEWLLIDDCSSDETFQLLTILASKEPKLRLFRNNTNSGAAHSRNVGVENAIGDYIAFLDADDLWESNKLQTQFDFMTSKNLAFSYHDYEIVNYKGKHQKQMHAPSEVNQSLLQKFNPIFTSSVMIRRNAIGHTRFRNELRRRQDYIFWFDMIKTVKKAYNIGKTLGSYRTGNESSLSHNKFHVIPIQWKIYRNEFNLNLFQSIYSLSAYALHGIKKYFL